MTRATQPVIWFVEPQPAALVCAYPRHRLEAAVDTAHEADQRSMFERMHHTVGDNVGARRNGLPTAGLWDHFRGGGRPGAPPRPPPRAAPTRPCGAPPPPPAAPAAADIPTITCRRLVASQPTDAA